MAPRQRILTAALTACMLLCALPGRSVASSTQQTILLDDGQLIYSSPGHVARRLRELHALGLDTVKLSVVWSLVAPAAGASRMPRFDATDPAAYPPGAWDRYDNVVKLDAQMGMRTYFQLTAPSPTWAKAGGLPRGQSESLGQAPVDRYFAQFVQAVGRRYSGSYTPAGSRSPLPRVDEWGIWNEPNFPSWLNPVHRRLRDGVEQTTQPWLYRGLIDAAWSGLLRSGHAHDTVLLGETASFGTVMPLPFIQDLFCLSSGYAPLRGRAAEAVACPTSGNWRAFRDQHPGLFSAAGYAHHPYSFDVAPDHPNPTRGWISLQNLWVLEQTLNTIYDRYDRSRRGGVPLYLSEWGYKTDPPNPYVHTTLNQQATWLNQGEYMTWGIGYVKALAQFLLVDDAPHTPAPVGSRTYWRTFQTGLIFRDGQHKPSYAAFRLPIWVPSPHPGSRVAIWGQLRPADHTRYQSGEIQFRRSRGGWRNLRSVQTASSQGFLWAHVSIPGPGDVRLQWRGPGAPAYYSRTVSIS